AARGRAELAYRVEELLDAGGVPGRVLERAAADVDEPRLGLVGWPGTQPGHAAASVSPGRSALGLREQRLVVGHRPGPRGVVRHGVMAHERGAPGSFDVQGAVAGQEPGVAGEPRQVAAEDEQVAGL